MMRRGLLPWLLLVALLWALWLGQVHRASHGLASASASVHGPVHDHAHAGAHAAEAGHAHGGTGWFATLFGHPDDGSEGCRLYDQCAHADLLHGVAALVLPLLPTAFLLRRLQGEAVARRAALFEARGPPSLR